VKRVENKVIAVTGGARGIGQAASILLPQEGTKVAVSDIVFNVPVSFLGRNTR